MNLKILSKSSALYSTNALVQAAIKRKHYVQVIDPSLCELVLEEQQPKITIGGIPLSTTTAIIPRIGATHTLSGSYAIRQFEQQGIYSLLSSEALLASRDKWQCLQKLHLAGVPIPTSLFVDHPTNFYLAFKSFTKFPVVIKLLESTHGKGVMLVDTKNSLRACLETFLQLSQPILIQEFIEESKGSDIRVIVVGDKIIAAMERKGIAGDFRSNLHLGGKAETVNLSEAEQEIALKAVKTLGLSVAGVDLLRSKRGPLVLEVNSSPGLEGIETITRVDIAKEIIKYIEQQLR